MKQSGYANKRGQKQKDVNGGFKEKVGRGWSLNIFEKWSKRACNKFGVAGIECKLSTGLYLDQVKETLWKRAALLMK